MTALVLAAVSLAACGEEGTPDVDRGSTPGDQIREEGLTALPVAIPPATVIPPGLNEVDLPPDVEPIPFSFTRVELTSAGQRSHTLAMLVADTFDRRTRGLSYRTELPPDTGMLYAFPAPTNSPFWNKDTSIDLDVALLSADGEIQEFLRLAALDTELVTPTIEYSYAVSIPQGWFEANDYTLGDRFLIPEGVVGLTE